MSAPFREPPKLDMRLTEARNALAQAEFQNRRLQTTIDALTAERDQATAEAAILKRYMGSLNEAIEQRDTLRAELGKACSVANNLLAVIHRDGGHYLHAHGEQKTIDDAHKIIADERAELAEVKAQRNSAVRLLHHYDEWRAEGTVCPHCAAAVTDFLAAPAASAIVRRWKALEAEHAAAVAISHASTTHSDDVRPWLAAVAAVEEEGK